ncbi:glycan biosynthesis hexose transferase WsfD [Carnobacterium gallinarum]|uniref:glycan biosynthesis hexose transferase WsfD n=1 Tax=Carnobacterium gallinarum TaxID=2749 RepID=UPI000689CB8A|nr:hypothetical protein [Carnobacterium gallinarum]
MRLLLQKIKSILEKPLHFISRFISPAWLAVLLVGIIVGILLFVPPINGIADNGDFFRMIYSNGLYELSKDSDQYFGYFVKNYGILQYYNENIASLFSSQTLFIQLALLLNKLFYSQAMFDIRFLGGLYFILYLGAIYLLTEGLTYGTKRKTGYILACIVVLVFGDTAYTLYFNSLYSEPIMFIMMLYVFAATLLLYRKRYNQIAMIVLLTVSSVFMITAKQQNAPLAVCIGLIFVGVLMVRKQLFYRLFVTLGLVLVLVSGALTYTLITTEFNNINQFQSMTRGVLLESENPEKALEDGNMEEQFALLKGNTYFQEYSAIDTNGNYMLKEFYDRYGFGWVLKHYLFNPADFYTILSAAANDIHQVQPYEMGNYEKSAGKPFKERTRYFTLYSSIKREFFPKTMGFLIIWTFVYLGIYFPSVYAAYKQNAPRRMLRYWLIIASLAMVFVILIVSVIGDGDADLAKHLFLSAVIFDFLTVMTVSDALTNRLWADRMEGDGLDK